MLLSDTLSLIAAAHCIFLSFLLKRFSSASATNLLVALLIAIALCSCTDAWMKSSVVYHYPQLAQLSVPLYLVIGPLLFFYTKTMLQLPVANRWGLSLHFLPAVIFYILIFLVNIFVDTDVLRRSLPADNINQEIDSVGIAIQLHIGFYLLASCWQWFQFERAVKLEYSNDLALIMNWLKQSLAIFLFMWTIWILGDFFNHSPFIVLTDLAIVIGVYFLGYSALIHKNLLLPLLKFQASGFESEVLASDAASVRYARAKLSDERVIELTQCLSQLISVEHIYLETDLTLSQLATRLSATNHEVSQLLNEKMSESFFDFINRHRVQEVQRCLHDPAYGQQTILDIALASGFSSKAAFNAAFKKVSGITPKEFKALRS